MAVTTEPPAAEPGRDGSISSPVYLDVMGREHELHEEFPLILLIESSAFTTSARDI
jgi:hypothetical protein